MGTPPIGNGQVTLSWTAPANSGGSAVTGYKVRRDAGGGGAWQAWVDKGNVLTHTFTGLANGTTYRFEVLAYNIVGDGTAAQATETLTLDNTSAELMEFQTNHGQLIAACAEYIAANDGSPPYSIDDLEEQLGQDIIDMYVKGNMEPAGAGYSVSNYKGYLRVESYFEEHNLAYAFGEGDTSGNPPDTLDPDALNMVIFEANHKILVSAVKRYMADYGIAPVSIEDLYNYFFTYNFIYMYTEPADPEDAEYTIGSNGTVTSIYNGVTMVNDNEQ
jgi:hypothetical protein